MPVLDAKALEVDSKGMAFLRSVLRPGPAEPKHPSNEVVPPKSVSQNVRVHFRLSRRIKQILPTLV